ncbi:MAG: cysteine rich repeat-containing protein [Caulobacter sp.]|nr:cysteine rich repeat-containing protein [Caulobacter sp.]
MNPSLIRPVLLILATVGLAAAAPRPAPPTKAEEAACRADYLRHCAMVAPGGGRGVACLMKVRDRLRPGCRQVLDRRAEDISAMTRPAP